MLNRIRANGPWASRAIWTLVFLAAGCPPAEDAPDGPSGGPTGDHPDAPPQTTSDAPPQGTSGWRAIALPAADDQSRVTGVYCTSRDACVVATDGFTDSGKLYAANDHAVGATLVDGDAVAPVAHVLGSIGFIGLETTRKGLTGRIDVSGAYVSGHGNLTDPANWTTVAMGTTNDGDGFGLNAQESLQAGVDGHWLFMNRDGYVYGATSAPATDTVWTKLWSPHAIPPVPANFDDLFAADPTICDSDISTREGGVSTQNVFISQDLSLAIHPAGGVNQTGEALPGVCISTDGGKTFYSRPFAGLPDVATPGPLAVTCLDANHCFAYNGLQFQDGSTYVYYSVDAAKGKTSTWTRATLPAALAAGDAQPRALFFAPDGVHGWLGGSKPGGTMLLRTTDAGHTWTDVSSSVSGLTDSRLHSGFALDNDHVWVGGENGTLLFTDTASK